MVGEFVVHVGGTAASIEAAGVASRRPDPATPALLVFQGGREVDRTVGVQPRSEIARRLQRVTT